MIQLTPLGDVAEVFNGKTPSKTEQRDSGHPVLKIKDVKNSGQFTGTFNSFVDDEFLLRHGSKAIKKDDSLILNAAHNADYVGTKQYRAETSVEGAIATGEWLIVRANRALLSPAYLHHWLSSPATRFKMKFLVKGIHLYPKDIQRMFLSLPSMEEQKRIAAILDKADAIRRKRQQAIELADQFLRSVFLDMFGERAAEQHGWVVKTLVEVADIQIGPFGSQLHKSDYIAGGIPLINPTHIVDGKLVPEYSLTVGDAQYKSLPVYHLKVGDIVMGRRGEMGRCALVSDSECGWMCGTGSLYIRPHEKDMFPTYLVSHLSGATVKRYLKRESLGATLPNLNKKIVGSIHVPVPPKDALEDFRKLHQRALELRDKLLKSADLKLFDSLFLRTFKGTSVHAGKDA